MKKVFVILMVAVLATAVNADLLHRYDFEVDASDSVGTADATVYGSASVTGGGLYSGGGWINGQLVGGIPNNGALVPASVAAELTGAFTIEAWHQAPYGGGYNTVFSFSDGTTSNYFLGTNARGNSPYGSGYAVIGGGGPVSELQGLGQWADNDTLQHMLITYDGTTLTYYQNGSTDYNGFNTANGTVASQVVPGLDLSTLPLIGINGGAPWPDNSINGSVWDFRIWDNAVAAGAAEALYALGPDAATEDVIAAAAIPEPATLALLGLGALVLRRKK